MAARRVVITGGGRGIGRAVASEFVRAGSQVVIVARDLAKLEEAAAATGAHQVEVCDVTDEAAVRELFARLPDVDVLVNNAGISSSAPLARTALEDWQRQIAVNATGAFLCTRAVVPGMLKRDRGRVVTVASISALAGSRYTAGYTASKHAAVGLMRAVAAEVAGTGVTVNAVCPGFVRTEMTEHTIENIVERTGRTAEQAEEAIAAMSPLKRLLEPEEVAAAVAFLASERTGAVNGQTIVLDGGGLQS